MLRNREGLASLSAPPEGLVGSRRPRTIWLFIALVVASAAITFHTNTVVLTDDVYRSLFSGQAGSAQIDRLIELVDRWTLVGYLATPLLLGVKIGLVALLAQLGLLAFGIRVPVGRAFRAGVWAHFALLVGTGIRNVWLASLPRAALTVERIEQVPGSGEWMLSGLGPFPPAFSELLRHLTIYQFGWLALFVLALEHRDRIPLRAAVLVGSAVWAVSVASRWGLSMYLGLASSG